MQKSAAENVSARATQRGDRYLRGERAEGTRRLLELACSSGSRSSSSAALPCNEPFEPSTRSHTSGT
jgi:hypothetical protein